ncbi:hypothetical protein NCC78_15930 [Micromonospora phytophila]|uniref:hypothetical protein n=1 Tax=Micromonospora phytophila TaxID=709888 RepID=UPI0020309AB2|nr:hypothetical protein [Micromonospora phytophila]MCM0676167.1 hypothetical protein [Micromonospora phytophila]
MWQPICTTAAMVDSAKSEAVRLYMSWGRNPWPRTNPDAVLGMSAASPEHLLRYAERVVQEMFDQFPVWDVGPGGLAQAADRVGAAMAVRHPELDAEAAKALAWMWSYSAR